MHNDMQYTISRHINNYYNISLFKKKVYGKYSQYPNVIK